MVLTAGFDHSEVSCIIEASPTKSLAKYLQQIGRGTRLKKGAFKDLIVLDIVDVTKRHKLVNCWELDKQKPPEERIFISDEKKEKLLASRQAKVVQTQIQVDERVNLLAIPKAKISNSIRMNEAASEKQLAWIESLGYPVKEVNYTKKMCSEIIGNLPATSNQLWAIKKMGYDTSNGVTIAEASLIFDIEKRKKEEEALKNDINSTNLDFKF
jgi:superfamily II DNA or RNA helicase